MSIMSFLKKIKKIRNYNFKIKKLIMKIIAIKFRIKKFKIYYKI